MLRIASVPPSRQSLLPVWSFDNFQRIAGDETNSRAPVSHRCCWSLLLWSSLEVRCAATKNKRGAKSISISLSRVGNNGTDTTTMMTGRVSAARVTGQHCCARPGLVLRVAESTGAALEGGRAVALGYWQAGRGNWSREGHDLSKVGPSLPRGLRARCLARRSISRAALVSHAILTSGDLWPWLALARL